MFARLKRPFIVLICLTNFNLSAAERGKEADKPKVKVPPVKVEKVEKSSLDSIHYQLSQDILGVANRVDRFFANEKAIQEQNETFILIDQLYKRRYSQSYKPSIRANISLPGTEKRINVFVENNRDRVANLAGVDAHQNLANEDDETRVGARFGILGQFSDLVSVTTRAGVSSLGFDWEQIDPFVDVRARYTKTWSKTFLTEGHVTPRYSLNDGREIESGVNFDYTPYEKWFFRLSNSSHWKDERKYTLWVNGFSVVYNLTTDRALLASFGIQSSDSGGVHLSSYNTSLGYQQFLYFKWLSLQITNFWEMPKENNFKRISSFEFLLRIRLGAI